MMNTRIISPLYDHFLILIIVDQVSQLLQFPHLRVALPGAPTSGHLLVLKMKPPSSPGYGYPPPVPNQLQLSSYTKYWSYTFRNLPRIWFVKQEQFKINWSMTNKILIVINKINISHIQYFFPYTPPGSPSQLSIPWTFPQLGGAALHPRRHQGSNILPRQKKEAKMSYIALRYRISGHKDES